MASLNPQIRKDNSPLRALAYNVIARFGDFHPEDIVGEVADLFIQFANEVLLDWNGHPYLDDEDLVEDFISVDDAKEIPDTVLSAGLYAKYCEQQHSDKIQGAFPAYMKLLNQKAYLVHTGGKSQPLAFKERK